ncbi:MAG: CotH kinase family protein [Bacteroidota bacterium]
MIRLFSLLPTLLLVVVHAQILLGQAPDTPYPVFSFDMPPESYQSVVESRGEKIEVYPASSLLNGEEIEVERLRVRGKSSLHFPKKSFCVRLASGTRIRLAGQSKKIAKKFYLMSLSQDLWHFHNRLAFLSMHEIGIFPLYNEYVEVIINGESQGIYLLLEHPEQYVLKSNDGDFLLRRGNEEQVDDYKAGKHLASKESRAYLKRFASIQKMCQSKKGERLYQALSQVLDLDSYMKWLAFNYWICNGDYADEVFFYSLPQQAGPLFSILPWDYDDIFYEAPHEGWETRNRELGSAMIFSSEDLLGRTIANDPFLYQQYLSIFANMLNQLNQDKITELFDQIRVELTPLMELPYFQEVNPYDKEGRIRAEIISQTMQTKEAYMQQKRTEFLSIFAD